MMRMFETSEITKLLDVLIGKTEAVGETNEDKRRLDNLKTLIDVTNWCLDGLEFAIASGRDRPEYSMAEISFTAQCALDEYGRWIADVLDWQITDRKTEPQLTPNYCGTCKHREVPCGDLPCDVCHGYSNYEPKDEPQKKYPTEWCKDCNLWRENNCMGVTQCKANMEALMKIYEASKTEPQTESSPKVPLKFPKSSDEAQAERSEE